MMFAGVRKRSVKFYTNLTVQETHAADRNGSVADIYDTVEDRRRLRTRMHLEGDETVPKEFP